MIIYSYKCSCGKGANIPRPSLSLEYGANSVHTKARQMHQPCLCLCLGSEQMTITLPLRRMILHFSHIGFTDGRTFILVPPVAVIFPQQIQAPFERMLNYYSRIYMVFNKKFKLMPIYYRRLICGAFFEASPSNTPSKIKNKWMPSEKDIQTGQIMPSASSRLSR